MLVLYHSSQFAMSHGSYDFNLGSEILILVGDIRSRSWPNIGGTYGMYIVLVSNEFSGRSTFIFWDHLCFNISLRSKRKQDLK